MCGIRIVLKMLKKEPNTPHVNFLKLHKMFNPIIFSQSLKIRENRIELKRYRVLMVFYLLFLSNTCYQSKNENIVLMSLHN